MSDSGFHIIVHQAKELFNFSIQIYTTYRVPEADGNAYLWEKMNEIKNDVGHRQQIFVLELKSILERLGHEKLLEEILATTNQADDPVESSMLFINGELGTMGDSLYSEQSGCLRTRRYLIDDGTYGHGGQRSSSLNQSRGVDIHYYANMSLKNQLISAVKTVLPRAEREAEELMNRRLPPPDPFRNVLQEVLHQAGIASHSTG